MLFEVLSCPLHRCSSACLKWDGIERTLEVGLGFLSISDCVSSGSGEDLQGAFELTADTYLREP